MGVTHELMPRFMQGLGKWLMRGTPWITMSSQRREVPPEKKMEDYLKSYTYWTYACARVIAENVAGVPYKLVYLNPKDGTEEDIHEHALLDLLETANPWMTEFELRELTQIHMELVGEAWWVFEKSKLGFAAEIWPLMPHLVTVIPGNNAYISGIEYKIPGETAIRYPVEDVVQFRYANPTNMYRGYSPTRAAAVPLDVMNYAQEWVRNFFFNDATPSGILSTDQILTQPAAEMLQERWGAAHKGRAKAHRIAVLGQGTKFQIIERSLKELTFTEEQRRLRDDVLALYGVPKAVLGIVEDVNRANAEASEYVFAKRVIAPRLRRMETRMNEYVVKRLFKDERLRLRFVDPVPENMDQKKTQAEFGLKAGILTVNEARKMIGHDALDGGNGDVLLLPTNALPTNPADLLTMAADEPEPPPDATTPPDPNNPPDDPQNAPDGNGDGGPPPDVGANAPEKPPAPTEGKALTRDAEVRWKSWVMLTTPHERRVVAELKRFYQQQQNYVMAQLKNAPPGKAVRTPPDDPTASPPPNINIDIYLWDSAAAREELERRLGPLLTNIIMDAGQRALVDLGLSMSFDVEHPAIKTGFVEQMRKITGTDDTTRASLRDEFLAGLKAGEGVPQLADRVSRVFQDAKGRRAQTIARTEVNGAASLGTHTAWVQSKVVVGKEWVSAGDERTRTEPYNHLDAGGEIVPLDAKFQRTGQAMPYPGWPGGAAANVINCRCTMSPVTKSQRDS